jgi:hypothetical protein
MKPSFFWQENDRFRSKPDKQSVPSRNAQLFIKCPDCSESKYSGDLYFAKWHIFPGKRAHVQEMHDHIFHGGARTKKIRAGNNNQHPLTSTTWEKAGPFSGSPGATGLVAVLSVISLVTPDNTTISGPGCPVLPSRYDWYCQP